jgi:hypothetical protein
MGRITTVVRLQKDPEYLFTAAAAEPIFTRRYGEGVVSKASWKSAEVAACYG